MARDRHSYVQFAAGSVYSEPVTLQGGNWVGMLMPDAFDGIEVSIEVLRPPDGAFLPHYDAVGNVVSITVGPSRSVAMDGEVGGMTERGVFRLKATAAQSQPRTLVMVIKDV